MCTKKVLDCEMCALHDRLNEIDEEIALIEAEDNSPELLETAHNERLKVQQQFSKINDVLKGQDG